MSLLDTACARVAISQHAVPAQLEDCRARIEALQTELEIIGREEAVGIDVTDRKQAATRSWPRGEAQRAELEAALGGRARAGRSHPGDSREAAAGSEQVEGTGSQLEQAAQAQKAAGAGVAVADAPASETAAPVDRQQLLVELSRSAGEAHGVAGRVAADPAERRRAGRRVGRAGLDRRARRPDGQERDRDRAQPCRHAEPARHRPAARARHDREAHPDVARQARQPEQADRRVHAVRPLGRRQDRDRAHAGRGALRRRAERHHHQHERVPGSAHRLDAQGLAAGYVGYGEGGVLTEAVRRRPYSVVLLDEVEKAHSDVHELFFQVFDKGWMEDGEGRDIDFKNTIILLTSNVGTDLIMSMCRDPELMPEPDGIAKALREPLLKVFPAALLGRLVVIPYYPLSDEMLASIVRLQLGRIAKRVTEHHKIPFTYDDDAVKLIVSRCTEVESGGRMIDAILTNTVLPAISREFLTRTMAGQSLNGVRAGRRRRRLRLPVRLSVGMNRARGSIEETHMDGETKRVELTVDEALALAVEFLKKGQFGEAEVILHAVLKLEPGNADALHYSGIVAHKRGNNDGSDRSDRPEPRACSGPAGLVQQPRHRAAVEPAVRGGDGGVPPRHRARSGARKRAQQPRRAAEALRPARGG